VYEVLYELDVVALTSLNEGTPNSLIEAQLCAKPVVAYNVGGVKDTFLDSVSGFLVEKNNTSDFVEKLLLLATDKNLRIKMGTEGKSFSEHKYSKLTEVRLMDELYSALLKKSSATKIV
jgi:glycosyltransferase involved in cell wall biosynthesis